MTPVQILHEMLGANTAVVTIIGQLDESNVDDRSKDIYAIIDILPQNSAIIFNLSGLEYMNSKSIGYTMDFFNKMNEKEGLMLIAEPQVQIEDILTVVGASQVITIVSSLHEAKIIVEEKIGIDPLHSQVLTAEPIIAVSSEETLASSAQNKVSAVPQVEVAHEVASYLQAKKMQISAQTNEENVNIQNTEKIVPHSEEMPKIIFDESFAASASQTPSPSQESTVPDAPIQSNLDQNEVIPNLQNSTSPAVKPTEIEFPILGIAVVIGLTIIILALIFK